VRSTQRAVPEIGPVPFFEDPVDLDADGLRVALEDLAEEVRQSHGVDCRLECPASIHVQDNLVATQLYLIVREAAHNAVKHALAKRITIRVEEPDAREPDRPTGGGVR